MASAIKIFIFFFGNLLFIGIFAEIASRTNFIKRNLSLILVIAIIFWVSINVVVLNILLPGESYVVAKIRGSDYVMEVTCIEKGPRHPLFGSQCEKWSNPYSVPIKTAERDFMERSFIVLVLGAIIGISGYKELKKTILH